MPSSKSKLAPPLHPQSPASQPLSLSLPPTVSAADDDDDDFQSPTYALPLPTSTSTKKLSSSQPRPPLKPSNSNTSLRSSKRLKHSINPGKENLPSDSDKICSSIAESQVDCTSGVVSDHCERICEEELKVNGGYLSNSIESRLMVTRLDSRSVVGNAGLSDDESEDFEPGTQLEALLNLCSHGDVEDNSSGVDFQEHGSGGGLVHCPLCGVDISDLSEELRQVHTNDCLDKGDSENVVSADDRGPQFSHQIVDDSSAQSSRQAMDVPPVLVWLRNLGLGKYEEVFKREEIDWDTLQWLTEEDLLSIGVTALGPRKKILHALAELRRGSTHTIDMCAGTSKSNVEETSKVAGSKLITDYFAGSVADRNKCCAISNVQRVKEKSCSVSGRKQVNNRIKNGKLRDVPLWCCIPGTPFRVDAFRHLRGDCSHWFLTHFHMDHYQGLTRSFCHGKIYCSLITARLVSMKIGIPWDMLQVLPLNQKISVAGIGVTCLDANHCPGSIIILFEPPSGKAVLHTGDFRFSEEMTSMPALLKCPIHTLILDTTYCNPQYDFPKQEAVIQFVIEAIQAEAFNVKTLFLIGSYTIGKERLFLEVARVLRKKVYVTAAKMRLLECLGLPEEDLQWLTSNEQESHVHVVPMWTLASFRRLKHISNQYAARFSLIVAFSPTGWTFGKGKKSPGPGRRWQQGTIIRYEVPYSEHCSFTELKEFVKFISP
ncbi:uncharacterized protein LOC131150797 isoform X2 [Malania oleifera]|nr:uncharacterized protein LOC131150797 isoform X2 [Malania oleifera]